MHLHRNLDISESIAHTRYACKICGWENIIEKIISENHELLDRLGSDYDENGVPYWDK